MLETLLAPKKQIVWDPWHRSSPHAGTATKPLGVLNNKLGVGVRKTYVWVSAHNLLAMSPWVHYLSESQVPRQQSEVNYGTYYTVSVLGLYSVTAILPLL